MKITQTQGVLESRNPPNRIMPAPEHVADLILGLGNTRPNNYLETDGRRGIPGSTEMRTRYEGGKQALIATEDAIAARRRS